MCHWACNVTVWRWVGWLGRLTPPGSILAAIAQFDGDSPAASLVPCAVPQDHEKAYSAERAELLRQALRTVALVCLLARVLTVPPADSSPLRWLLRAQFEAFPHPIGLREAVESPAFHIWGRWFPRGTR